MKDFKTRSRSLALSMHSRHVRMQNFHQIELHIARTNYRDFAKGIFKVRQLEHRLVIERETSDMKLACARNTGDSLDLFAEI